MKICIELPDTFYNERKYAFELLLGYFKDATLNFTRGGESPHYAILLENNKRILIGNSLFRSEPSPMHFPGHIPRKSDIQFASVVINNTPCKYVHIFGDKTEVTIEESKSIISPDLIANTFFMVTGYEEYQSDAKDDHGRFPDDESLAVKAGFHRRPIVNEYMELLRQLISQLSGSTVEYNRRYTAFITHDVDEIFRLKPGIKALKKLGGDLLNRQSVNEFFTTLLQSIETLFKPKRDPAYVFDYFMDISEKYGIQSHFYFICGKPGETDFQYNIESKAVIELIQNIQSRNHRIGFHASYGTPGNFKQFDTELNRLKKVCGSDQKITEGRQHFLRLKIPEVWQHWEAAGMKVDSSMGYHNYCGFRRGICYEYPVFDLEKGEKLTLKERPLIFMEVALKRETPDPETFKAAYIELVNTVRKYHGDFVFLWHNSNINHPYWRNYAPLYEELVEVATAI